MLLCSKNREKCGLWLKHELAGSVNKDWLIVGDSASSWMDQTEPGADAGNVPMAVLGGTGHERWANEDASVPSERATSRTTVVHSRILPVQCGGRRCLPASLFARDAGRSRRSSRSFSHAHRRFHGIAAAAQESSPQGGHGRNARQSDAASRARLSFSVRQLAADFSQRETLSTTSVRKTGTP